MLYQEIPEIQSWIVFGAFFSALRIQTLPGIDTRGHHERRLTFFDGVWNRVPL